mmetsp:Transcript_10108/g.24242  ORF Transcript_10108/g.24242 Transcript_10108/m.24242 type:complete len:517 (+) Transcript_10108:151-1701(+)
MPSNINDSSRSRLISCLCIVSTSFVLSPALIKSVAATSHFESAEVDAGTADIRSPLIDDKSSPYSSSCDTGVYYQAIKSDFTRNELQQLLEATHRRVLPYSDDDKDDVWKALKDLDRGIDSNGLPTVRLIYSKRDVPAEPKGRPDTWNREHLWPKSRGVGYSGPDFTDVHHLFPADWGINSIRSNRYFDFCTSNGERDCRSPSELEGIEDPPMFGRDIFQPPPEVRGDIARAIFYMDLRYPHLELTDTLDPEKSNQMAFLSTLLTWHHLDPPTKAERKRNYRACSRWQGNRNPFVDYPGLTKTIYGPQKEHVPVPGDVMCIGVHADNPDLVALVSLVDIPAGLVIHVTDSAFDGKTFSSREGTMSLTLSETIRAGTVFGYGEGLLYGSLWTSEVNKGFSLSARGDNIIVYYTSSMESDDYTFLSAISFAGGAFLASEGEPVSYSSASSALPDSIEIFAIALGTKDNYVYSGKKSDSKELLQEHLLDKTNWKGSNSKTDVPILPLVDKDMGGFIVLT